MPLLGGRGRRALTPEDVTRVADTFHGLDREVRSVRHEVGARTVFRVVGAEESENGEEHGEIIFGPDIFPGEGIADPNSILTMRAAAAHELSHYHRWFDRRQIDEPGMIHVDEALTSLEAVQRYGRSLNQVEVEQLVGDALHRLRLHFFDPVEQTEPDEDVE